ncbi:sialin-like isoform X2 [Mercenaria mercenaria]|uniref:sialin-like isoform X2 n=1 Tax=Mercenaria mercenaria TaxID=6596 RepID=UPI00234EB856|nr:sialin-like isoform X2 [Mercenaria mercenaria]XP_053397624.1 sialin-like isoform X2 [Mercenaria mercenaria]XP_053397625.1 sialin-like isoform X2 [Mercenaria mercenaria]XP_053397626.1 sialin-like isoform X2 [Mercenaria mercenaria]XP_053397627.1 sialin-like isoform X2 [Mercenaria mercenaria]
MTESKWETNTSLLQTNTGDIKGSGNSRHDEDLHDTQQPDCCSQRWILAFMAVWLGSMSFMLNSSMNLAIVCMVKSNTDDLLHEPVLSYETSYNNSIINETLFIEKSANKLSTDYPTMKNNMTLISFDLADSCDTSSKSRNLYSERAEFSWSKTTQSMVLSSYYYDYLIMQIPGGWLAARFGGKHVIGISMTLSSALTILIPVLARASVHCVVIARALLGLCIGTTSPSICGLIGRWALPTERIRFLGMCWFGQNIGAVIGYSTSGLLCVHGFDNGWASIFYIQGVITLLFVCSWWYVIYNTPQNHPRISAAEKRLILKYVPLDIKSKSNKQNNDVPWKNIFSYLPVYIVYIIHLCDTWTYYLLLTCLPLFLKEVLKFDILSNGIFSCLPYLSFMAGIAVAGVCADLIRSWTKVSITTIRKVFQIAGFLGIAVFILIPGYLTCEYRYGVIACLCLCTLFEAIGITGGHIPNIVDIAPRYSSIIFGISNTIATIPGIVAPIVVGEITKTGTNEEWRVTFFIAAGVALFAAVLYGIFADSELAPWAKGKEDQIEIEVQVSNEIVANETDINSRKCDL